MEKQCKRCLKWFDTSLFRKHNETRDRLTGNCKFCINELQRIARDRTNNAYTRKYEKTKKGFLMRLYRNMKSRIEGVQKQKSYLYLNKSMLNKEQFYEWGMNQSSFHNLFDIYEKSGYQRKLCPSVDRIDSSLGYELDNMEWVTMSENSRRGAKNKKKKPQIE